MALQSMGQSSPLSQRQELATTDASGAYSIAQVAPGQYAVFAAKNGYTSSKTVSVTKGATATADFAFSISGGWTGDFLTFGVSRIGDASAITGVTILRYTVVGCSSVTSYIYDDIPIKNLAFSYSKTDTLFGGSTTVRNIQGTFTSWTHAEGFFSETLNLGSCGRVTASHSWSASRP